MKTVTEHALCEKILTQKQDKIKLLETKLLLTYVILVLTYVILVAHVVIITIDNFWS